MSVYGYNKTYIMIYFYVIYISYNTKSILQIVELTQLDDSIQIEDSIRHSPGAGRVTASRTSSRQVELSRRI